MMSSYELLYTRFANIPYSSVSSNQPYAATGPAARARMAARNDFFADSTQDWPGNSYPGLDPEQLSRDERNYWQILNGVTHIDAAGGDETPANAVLYEQAAR